jgi:cytochrome c-type biogenesis protein CcmI
VAYLAAAMIIAGVALFVAAPLAGGIVSGRGAKPDADLEHLEHERGLAVQALRELEFDRETGKLSDADYQTLRAELERKALTAMAALEKERAPQRGRAHLRRVDFGRAASLARTSEPRRINFCPRCGARALAEAKFCAECGLALRPREIASGGAE